MDACTPSEVLISKRLMSMAFTLWMICVERDTHTMQMATPASIEGWPSDSTGPVSAVTMLGMSRPTDVAAIVASTTVAMSRRSRQRFMYSSRSLIPRERWGRGR